MNNDRASKETCDPWLFNINTCKNGVLIKWWPVLEKRTILYNVQNPCLQRVRYSETPLYYIQEMTDAWLKSGMSIAYNVRVSAQHFP